MDAVGPVAEAIPVTLVSFLVAASLQRLWRWVDLPRPKLAWVAVPAVILATYLFNRRAATLLAVSMLLLAIAEWVIAWIGRGARRWRQKRNG